MREGQRVIAVEVVNHPAVQRCGQVLHRVRTVVPVAADQDQRVRRDGADAADTGLGNAVPRVDEARIGHLVEQLKGNILRVTEPAGHFFPEGIEAVLQFFVCKETAFRFPDIKGKTGGFMQVQHDLQAAGFAPADGTANPHEALFTPAAVLVFQYVVIHRDPDMVQTPGSDCVEVFFGNEMLQPVLGIVTLREPAPQVDTAAETEIAELHADHPPWHYV